MKRHISHALAIIAVYTILVATTATLLLTIPHWLPFAQNALTGMVPARSTVNIVNATEASCNATFNVGLTIASFFCIPTYVDRDTITTHLPPYEAIFEYVPGASDPWRSYNPNLPAYVVQDLTYFTREKGYYIRFTSPGQFNYPGILPKPGRAPLTQGWNLAGYVLNETRTIANATASIAGNYTVIRTLDPTGSSYQTYQPGLGGSLNQTDPYKGYWINATTTEVWEVS